MADTKYCVCCGEMVPYNYVERHERREITCAYCGFTLDVQKLWEPSKVSDGYVLVADDSKYVRDIIIDALKSNRVYTNIMAAENGLELTAAFSKLATGKAAVDIAIIDLNMPIMDGVTAARTIRAIEAQHHMPATPIIFFSAEKADDSLRAQMELLSPASYMNKGSDPDPGSLAVRVEQLVGYLIEKHRKPPQ
jgi:CheY-like chemotaxis protein